MAVGQCNIFTDAFYTDNLTTAFGLLEGNSLKTLHCIWHLTHRLRLDGKGASRPLLVCKKTYSTGYSQAVTNPSTNPAQCCLTSVIRREPVHSAWYGRRTMQHLHRRLLYRQSDHRIWAFGGKQLKNVTLHLASYAQIKIGWKRGISPIAGMQKDLQHWVFPGGHPSKY